MHVVRSRRIIARGCNSTPFTHTHAQTIQTSRTRVFYDMRGDTQQFKGLVENEKQKKGYRLIFNFLLVIFFFYTILTVFSISFTGCDVPMIRGRDGTNGAQQWDFASRRYRRFISIIRQRLGRVRMYYVQGIHRPRTYATTI